jgi:hypothetical protein
MSDSESSRQERLAQLRKETDWLDEALSEYERRRLMRLLLPRDDGSAETEGAK